MSGTVCPYCRFEVDLTDGSGLLCEGCGTPHHKDCYAENGGCTVFGCRCAPPEEPKVAVSAPELATAPSAPPAAARVPTFGGYASLPASARVPTFGGYASSGRATGVQTAPSSTPVIESAITNVPPPEAKKKMTFIMLGIFLGALGAHNFYAGYYGKATTQLCLSVLTIGYGSPMSWLWAVIEICTVNQDSKGVQFSS